jgi:4-hydroxybenzoyl-CoA thioesterase
MFYPRFFALVNEAVEDWFAAMGTSFKALHIEQRKGVPTVKLNAEFVRPARIGDRITQRLRVSHLGGASCKLHHEAIVAGVVIATFDHTIVYVDLDAMKPEPWPPALRAAMARFAEDA